MKSHAQFPLFKYADDAAAPAAPAQPAATAQKPRQSNAPPPRELTEKEKSTTFDQLMAYQRAAEQKYGLPSKMLAMTVYMESRGDPTRVSDKGAQGLYQILPSVVKKLSDIKGGKKDKTAYYMNDMYDPEECTNAVAQHLAETRSSMLALPNVDKYKGLGFDKGWELVALEYIAGRGNIIKWLAAGAPTEVKEIDELKKANKYNSKIGPQSLARLRDMTRELQSGSFNVEKLRPVYETALGQAKTA